MTTRTRWAFAALAFLSMLDRVAASAQANLPRPAPDIPIPTLTLHLPIPTAVTPQLAKVPSDVFGLRSSSPIERMQPTIRQLPPAVAKQISDQLEASGVARVLAHQLELYEVSLPGQDARLSQDFRFQLSVWSRAVVP